MEQTPEQAAEERLERARKTWQYRAIERLRGNQTEAGRILIAALGRPAAVLGRTATIDEFGVIRAGLYQPSGQYHFSVPVTTVDLMVEGFTRLCEALKFTHTERDALFAELRKWCAVDQRALEGKEVPRSIGWRHG